MVYAVGGADQPPGNEGGQAEGEHPAAQQENIQIPAAQKNPETQPGDQHPQARNENGIQGKKQPGGFEYIYRGPKFRAGPEEDGIEQDEQDNGQGFGPAEQVGQEPSLFGSFCWMLHKTITP
jgi:hypothetical protein